jgi:hypothetical protein
VFTGNSADEGGGAVRTWGAFFLALNDCLFEGNSAVGDPAAYWPPLGGGGGGAYLMGGEVALRRCTFSGNTVATADCLGGGLDANCKSLLVDRCTFLCNSAPRGGGVGLGRNSSSASAHVVNSVFMGNFAAHGGGLYHAHAFCDTWMMENCTLTANTATVSGGAIEIDPYAGSCDLRNIIAWGNAAGSEIEDIDGDCDVTHSCVGQTGYAGTDGNIDTDPLFVDADGPDNVIGTADDDVRPQPGSPCIDSGDPATTLTKDITGAPRPQGSGYDMGAYER